MRYCFLIVVVSLFSCSSTQTKEEGKEIEVTIGLTAWKAPQNASYRGISVLDSQTVWISGSKGAIVRSLDAGSYWELINPPDQDSLDFRDVHAFSKDHALVSSAGFPARIYLTHNAGTNWELVYENLDSSAFLNAVHFKDSLNGLVVGDRLDGYHFVLSTEDGGSTWMRIDSSKLPALLEVEHGFAASGSCIALNANCNWVMAYGGEKSRIFNGNLADGWQAIEVDLADSSASSGIYSIAANKDEMMVVGGDYTKLNAESKCFFSSDGGNNWKSMTSLDGYRSVVDHSVAGDIWLAGGINGLEYSMDDGNRWNRIANINLNSLQFEDQSGVCFAAGPDGKLYKIHFKLNIP